MDNRPIGFFDSGLGGLTSVSALQSRLPKERVIYYGDTARTPYGSKSPETIRKFASQIVDYLVSKDVKMVVIACNTVTSLALDDLRQQHPELPIIGVIEPTVRKVVQSHCPNVGIIATKATIQSDVYARLLHNLDPSIRTSSLACPAFVPLIEEGIIDNEIMDLTIRYYMDDFVRENGFNHLILGCTHYPMIADNLKRIYPNMNLISSSEAVIDEVEEVLAARDQFAEQRTEEDRFYASDLSDNFIRMTDRLTEGKKFQDKTNGKIGRMKGDYPQKSHFVEWMCARLSPIH